ncbi:AlkA N-terminal domain-containing protein [Caulobacter mirabilis]|uniref:DNA-3-methyladenine glycosylase II n=1 Tax=Caulobacter mirabilis TaxID=69666 RepID=A0A2D2AU47_9CAUL|nr:AlkA N-terminal domain-containing protein [Caulobacter mirabilis]ATQ41521.1 3-methyladenine DNA glycosylase 2 [Caulobacter mirabilis]
MDTPTPPIDLDQDACYRAVETRDPRWDGRIFGCVRTTGIYCRPVCPARTPKRENMIFYPSAAACEEAGFRACLRCRPETAPDMGAWRGSSNTVSRALALIELGALDSSKEDGGDVDALAGRLGVGERQLRRLFRQHLGASPVGVAQTRRVLLAKQLIHETDLPMAEVALAAGFGSVRRFNETFQRLYGRPPSALRRRETPRDGRPGAVTLKLRYRPPYDWDSLIGFLAARAIPLVEVVTPGRYARTISFDGSMGTVAVSRAGGDQLTVEVRFPKMTALPQILARVRRVFDLTADPATIETHLGRDPTLAAMIAERPGLRAPGAWDGFEVGVRAILGQQITVSAAVKLAGKLTAEYGAPLPEDWAEPGLTLAFPEPERLAEADIAGHGLMPGARARAISSMAAAVVADPDLLGARATLEEAVAALRALPGIGEWTAQYIAMRQLREPDAFPAADIGLMRALQDEAGVRPTPAQLLARAEAWRPWRAYAALHLWASDPQAPKPSVVKEAADARRAA